MSATTFRKLIMSFTFEGGGGGNLVTTREDNIKISQNRPVPHNPRVNGPEFKEKSRSQRSQVGPITVGDSEEKPVHFPSQDYVDQKDANPILNTIKESGIPS